jgi:hypothetical protein
MTPKGKTRAQSLQSIAQLAKGAQKPAPKAPARAKSAVIQTKPRPNTRQNSGAPTSKANVHKSLASAAAKSAITDVDDSEDDDEERPLMAYNEPDHNIMNTF